MTQEEVNGCEIINEFMGQNNYKYNIDWRMLMPVVEKIEDIDFNKNLGYSVTIVQFVCLIKRNSFTIGNQELIIDSPGSSKIDATFRGIVQFLKWYNKQNTSNEKQIL